jgi:hypothetical protein
MAERWRVIPDFTNYEVSDRGLVRNRTTEKLLTPFLDHGGYARVGLFDAPRRTTRSIHRLVAIAFLGQSEDKKAEVDHINRDRADNRLENLKWVTPLENAMNTVIYRQTDDPKVHHKRAQSRQQKSELVECDCGSTVRRGSLARHRQTKKHRDYLQENPPPTTTLAPQLGSLRSPRFAPLRFTPRRFAPLTLHSAPPQMLS